MTITTTLEETEPQLNSNPAYLYFRRNFETYKISSSMRNWLRSHIAELDLVHVHALFSFSSTAATRIARRRGIPYLVRPLGVLNSWGMENRRRILKKISLRYIELPLLLNSAAIHYTSPAEEKEAGRLDYRLAQHRSAVIPLPLVMPKGGSKRLILQRYPQLSNGSVILFLSRIHPKKGIELLLDAFALVHKRNREATLIIAGAGADSYVSELRARRSAVDCAEHIIWAGHLEGEDKASVYAVADLFVLASHSENFGIAAAESLAAGVPTIVSEEVGVSADVREYNAGFIVRRDPCSLAAAIVEVLDNPDRARQLAENGQRLARERYSPDAVGRALKQLYEEIIEAHRRR